MLRRIGAAQDDLEGRSFGPQTHQGPMVISGDPTRDTLGSRRVTVESVRRLKELVGIPDEQVRSMPEAGDAVRYPAAPRIDVGATIDRARSNGQALEDLIHPADQETIDLALHAYVMGDSDRVRLYEPLIDALRFPAELVVATAQDLTVTVNNNPLVIGPDTYAQKDPTLAAVAAFGTLTVESGCSIQISIPAYITADRLIFKGPEPGLVLVLGTDGTPGRAGTDGAKGVRGSGADGVWGQTFPLDQKVCWSSPTKATNGGSGDPGTPGAPGGNGKAPAGVTFIVGNLSGKLRVWAAHGYGGSGGTGGNGGPGGDGGAASKVTPECQGAIDPQTSRTYGPTMPPGATGPGGNGGDGGYGGNGASFGPQITFHCGSLDPDSEWDFGMNFGGGGTGAWGGQSGGPGGRTGDPGRPGSDTPSGNRPVLSVRPLDPSSL